jgi:uridine kinase
MSLKPPPRHPSVPLIVAIVGGSGSGKSWLAQQLLTALHPEANHLCLDDFYLDRSHLSPGRRANLNFDHPRAIDWREFERVVRALQLGRPVRVPVYDFATHCRAGATRLLLPKPVLLIEGLWLLRRPSLRKLFTFRVFLDCPTALRLRRRLSRDRLARGRTPQSITAQFWKTVEPMHRKFVAPQARWADILLPAHHRQRLVRKLVSDLRQWAGA